ncbi:VOC family protein [Microlunatus parietis]|uniref:DNA-binding transcriptional MerR regulator/catechol 2,3-dioxygenase-like lactoylglutathione lyase family enzyme n=1 Tax=Microlunatus parietis TaxID=682979 RepID=A0A7Y9LED8_9ACTN|nr:VOC family protein [Microlunatus parietis]NYE72946.1 DNA-binding transcriptional MerR regulator/catechol 2,3-dioxygenase-like lactoylglutathione lyase family enzyme [Microlunatus parietis]
MDDELMAIGRFAKLSGVSVHALRHYDEVGLLRPAEVDGDTSYRRYRPEQIRLAKLIRALRGLDLPIEAVRQVLDSDEAEAERVLLEHRRRLQLERSHLDIRIADVNRFLEKGLTMPTLQTGCRPVQFKLRVDDHEAALPLYRDALGLPYGVARRTSHGNASALTFGTYGEEDFFLIWLLDDPQRADLPGPSTFGLLVEDLDGTHAAALAAGAVEVTCPHTPEGMPRCSAIKDAGGNWIWLYQGQPGSPAPCQLKLAVDNLDRSIAFYTTVFGGPYETVRRTGNGDFSAITFGEYGKPGFFLLHLIDDHERFDRPGRAAFSFLVDDLDAVHARALAAGATELHPPSDAEGMPRSSGLLDPDGNQVGLAQG